ncbi:MAG: PQQ-binding-like beta-propeller repeat protein [Pseudothermotoga sp.]|nr:PQQ-binding-like beta-propeller repeat protein [Pseudothermotoga sp.]
MKRTILLLLFIIYFASSALFSSAASYPFLNHDGFVVVLSDLHFPFAKGTVQTLIQRVCDLKPESVFVLGDLTEMGSDYEFSELDKILAKLRESNVMVYTLPGNHDTRWSSRNRKGERGFKPFRTSNGIFEFIGLDTSMYFEQHGHIGNKQMEWLRDQLLNAEKPIVVMAHHPFGGPSNFTDDGWKLMNLIDEVNVAIVLVGHGHSYNVRGMYNGAWFQMVGAAKDGWFTVLSWKGEDAFLWSVNITGGCNLLKQLSVSREKRHTQSIKTKLMQVSHDRVQLQLELQGVEEVTIEINGSSVAKFSAAEIEEKPDLNLNVDLRNCASVFIKVLGRGESGYTERYIYSDVDSPSLVWRFKAQDGIFAKPNCENDVLCFADLSGTVYLLDKAGKLLWERSGDHPVVSSVVLWRDQIIVGDVGGNLVSYNLDSHEPKWSKTLKDPIFSLAKGQRVLGVGSGENFILVDPENGGIIKKIYMHGMVQSPAKFHEETSSFIQTSWGGALYVIGEKGELNKSYAVGAGYETAAPCTPDVLGEWIIFTNTSGALHGQSMLSKSKRWRKTSLGVGYSSIVVDAQGFAYASSINGAVYKFNPVDGEIVWEVDVGEPIYDSSPQLLMGNKLIVGTTSGSVVILDTDGRIVKKFYLGPGYIFAKACQLESGVVVASMSGEAVLLSLEN